MLGNAETIGQQHDLFQSVSRKWRLYRRINTARPAKLDLPVNFFPNPRQPHQSTPAPAQQQSQRLTAIGHKVLSRHFAPASALINRKGEVLYLHGQMEQYLRMPSGEMNQDLISMVRPGLRTSVRSAFHRALSENKAVALCKTRAKRGAPPSSVQITIESISEAGAENLLLVYFEEMDENQKLVRVVHIDSPDPEPMDNPSTSAEYETVIRRMDDELLNSRADLQSTVEELATSNEEFKAANEEVTSINEELQSTNEELETSKEELQSMNEELQTVNSQLELKIHELESSSNDIQNLLESIDSATIILDAHFCIRQFTPFTTRLLRIIEKDLGRPFSDFSRNIPDPDILTDAAMVLRMLTPIESEIHHGDGQYYLRKIVPYRTRNGHIDGVVISFTDITRAKQDFLTIHESQQRFSGFMKHLPGMSWIKDAQGRYVFANAAALENLGHTEATLHGQTDENIYSSEAASNFMEHDRNALSSGTAVRAIDSLEHADGSTRHCMIVRFPIPDAHGKMIFVAGIAIDITDRIQAEEDLRQAREQLDLVAQTMAVGVAQCSRDSRYLWVNTAYSQLTSFSVSGLIGQSIESVLGKENFEILRPKIERVLSGEKVSYETEVEYRIIGKRWVQVEYTPTCDSAGAVDGWVAVVADITDRKQSELALVKSEARISAILRASLDAIISIDSRGNVLEWNPAAEQLFGIPRSEAVGQEMAALIIPQRFRDRQRKGIARYMATGHGPILGQRIELMAMRRDGSEFPVEVSINRLPIAGSPIFKGFVRDITERKLAEQAISESEQRFRTMTEAAPMLVWMSNADKERIYFNTRWLQFTGRTLEQECNHGWLDGIHPDDLQQAMHIRTQAFDHRKLFELEYRLRHHDGEYRWILDRGAPRFHDDGGFVGYIGSCFDIHERKRVQAELQVSEERMRLAAQATGFGHYDLMVHSDQRNWSPEFYAIMGIDPSVKPGRDRFFERVHPEDRPLLKQATEQSMDPAGAGFVDTEFRIVRPSGLVCWVRYVSRTFFEGAGAQRKAVRIVGTIQDVTDRKRYELELERMTVTLEQQVADRTKRLRDATTRLQTTEESERRRLAKELHDGLSQDLVLARMKLSDLVSALDKGEIDDALLATKRTAGIIDQATRSSRLLVRQLSPTALYEAGLVAAIKALAEQMKEMYGLEVDTSAMDNDIEVNDDEKRIVLYRVIRELLINIAKHAGVKTAAIAMAWAKNRLMVLISDKGNGFDMAATSEGFGLFMTRERIENLKGTLAVNSKPGEGTRITMRIPLGISGRSSLFAKQ